MLKKHRNLFVSAFRRHLLRPERAHRHGE